MENQTRLLSVIDMGTTSIRCAIAQVQGDGTLKIIERLQQNVMLGNEVFSQGRISLPTVEACVDALRLFTTRLEEYQIPLDRDHVRTVATSAVQEADNREAFTDRVYIATGLEMELVDAAELSRFTYLSVQSFQDTPAFGEDTITLVVEVGGGSTEVLAVRDGQVLFSQGHRLGALRLWQLRHAPAGPLQDRRSVVESNISRFNDAIRTRLHDERSEELQILAVGGDARFAATKANPDWEQQRLVRLPVAQVEKLADEVLQQSEDELVRRHYISYPEAETLGAALLTYVRLAQALKRSHLYVTDVSMRDGVLTEMARRQIMTDEFRGQIISSAEVLSERYAVDQTHSRHVRRLSVRLFDLLHAYHSLDIRHRVILEVAALLHEVGMFVSTRSHHKHSFYLIWYSDIFGLSSRDREMAALLARYHRQSHPKSGHSEYASLDRTRRIVLCKLAAILRVADALERSHQQRIHDIELEFRKGEMRIIVTGVSNLTIEELALEEKADLFAQVYGMRVVLRALD